MSQDIRRWEQNQAVLRALGGGFVTPRGRRYHVQREHAKPPRTHAVLPLLQRLLLVLFIAHVPWDMAVDGLVPDLLVLGHAQPRARDRLRRPRTQTQLRAAQSSVLLLHPGRQLGPALRLHPLQPLQPRLDRLSAIGNHVQGHQEVRFVHLLIRFCCSQASACSHLPIVIELGTNRIR